MFEYTLKLQCSGLETDQGRLISRALVVSLILIHCGSVLIPLNLSIKVRLVKPLVEPSGTQGTQRQVYSSPKYEASYGYTTADTI